ncbi:hypothetical protein IscW_ISCW013203 [Ixodes scapularis]|uniref:ADAM10 cysteine-rich domain-containing protein n=1 Tax=Ixodes scapularis TaxID=6945 RepID=B7QDX2_IXOSC|nr:hypothetical protein IscW_ISCW013203 [Ixodes scapularis]|eukprot:XP_002413736.1 hypothetical protein IscW_ISCW013203 [Ixodes scapularis]
MKELCGRRMEPGAACDDMRGYCDVFRKCRRIDTQGPLSMLHDLVFGHMGLRNVLVVRPYLYSLPLSLLPTSSNN